jgi:hypothetical protein
MFRDNINIKKSPAWRSQILNRRKSGDWGKLGFDSVRLRVICIASIWVIVMLLILSV